MNAAFGFVKKYKVFILGILIWLVPVLVGTLMYLWYEPAQTQDTSEVSVSVQETSYMENPEKAKDYVKPVTVSLTASAQDEIWMGSAVIWDQTQEELIIATSAHLLEYANGQLTVSFDADTAAEAAVVGVSAKWDVGFVSCKKELLDDAFLEQLRYVRLHQRTFDTLLSGDECFTVGCSTEGVADVMQTLTLTQLSYTEDEIGENLFLLEGACEAGMSGSGLYDGYGNFIGMLIASDETDTLALTMEQVNEAYREVTGNVRSTEDY